MTLFTTFHKLKLISVVDDQPLCWHQPFLLPEPLHWPACRHTDWISKCILVSFHAEFHSKEVLQSRNG